MPRKPKPGESLGGKYPELIPLWNWELNKGLTPFDFFAHSGKSAIWDCPECGQIYPQRIGKKTQAKPQGCPICANIRLVPGVNDLLTKAPEIALEWNPINKLKPSEVIYGSHDKALWVCSKCGYGKNGEWYVEISNRVRNGTGCPACSNKVAWPGHNDLGTLFHDEIYRIWDWNRNKGLSPSDFTPGSGKRVHLLCPRGHHSRRQVCEIVNSIKRGHTGCPKCSSSSSYSEFAVYFYCKKAFGDEVEHMAKIGPKQSEADIYIKSIKTAIEYDGILYHSSKKAEGRDSSKDEYFDDLGIRLIRIKESDHNLVLDDVVYFEWDGFDGPNLQWALSALFAEMLDRDVEVNLALDMNAIAEIRKDHFIKESLSYTDPEVALRWDYEGNGSLKPEYFTRGSNFNVSWICSNHPLQPYRSSIKSQAANGHGCPYCSGKEVLVGFNDLATTHPRLAAQWHPIKNGNLESTDITAGSNKQVWRKCEKCGHEWLISPNSRTNSPRKNGEPSGCKKCSGLAPQKVKCVETGKIYRSCTEAGRDVGLSGASGVTLVCKGKQKTAGGFHWKYVASDFDESERLK